MKTLAMTLSTFFGIGFFPVAPGTAASLAAVVLFYFLLWPLPWFWTSGIIFICLAAGVPASARCAAELDRTDPRPVVIDEVCGQLIALFLIPADRTALLLAFLLFRLFDIVKPWPIRKLERFPGGWGIMADDVAAGLLARLCLQIYLFLR